MQNGSSLPARRRAFTLIEMVIVIAVAAIPITAVGVLLAGASRSWQKIYDESMSPARQDGYVIMASLQRFGRQANLTGYTIYRISGSTFSKATPLFGQVIAAGQAVEFRYWQDTFNPADPDIEVLDITNTGSHYALYYLDGRALKADFGRVIDGVGGVYGNSRQTAGLEETQVLSEHVNISNNIDIFNHIMLGGQGSGCVNTNLILADETGVSVELKFSTLIRSAWPR